MRLMVTVLAFSLIAGSCAAAGSHQLDCPQVAVGERILVKGAPIKTTSPWGFLLDTVRWTVDGGVEIVDWQLGGDLDNDALEALVRGEVAGPARMSVDYAQLSQDGLGPARLIHESCVIKVVEVPDHDLAGTWSLTRRVTAVDECIGGPMDGEVFADLTQDTSGNLTIEGLNTGYEPWSGSIDGSEVAFGGRRDEPTDLGGGSTDATFTLAATSRTRMTGAEAWSWTDGASSCSGTSEITARKS